MYLFIHSGVKCAVAPIIHEIYSIYKYIYSVVYSIKNFFNKITLSPTAVILCPSCSGPEGLIVLCSMLAVPKDSFFWTKIPDVVPEMCHFPSLGITAQMHISDHMTHC